MAAVGASAGTADGRRPRYDTETLLRVAAKVFTERGYDGTSMEDLAQASGLSKSSIYHHVDGKEHLLRLSLERAVGPLAAIAEEPAGREGRAIDRLEYVVRRAVAVLVAELPSVTLLLRVRGNTATERWAMDQRRAFDRFVAGIVAEAAADGDVRTDVDPLVLARLLFGMVNSLVEWYRPAHGPGGSGGAGGSGGGRLGAEDLADAVVRLSFEGLRRPSRTPSER
jgi:AcrR family transcriptional regulator